MKVEKAKLSFCVPFSLHSEWKLDLRGVEPSMHIWSDHSTRHHDGDHIAQEKTATSPLRPAQEQL